MHTDASTRAHAHACTHARTDFGILCSNARTGESARAHRSALDRSASLGAHRRFSSAFAMRSCAGDGPSVPSSPIVPNGAAHSNSSKNWRYIAVAAQRAGGRCDRSRRDEVLREYCIETGPVVGGSKFPAHDCKPTVE